MGNKILRAAIMMLVGWYASAEDAFPPSLAREVYDRVSPAICVLSYSSEITNPASGEVTKRATNALGVIVSSDGLVMTHGHMLLENARPFSIRVKVGQGELEKEYDGQILRKPEDLNVCFVRIVTSESVGFPYVRFDAEARLEVGEEVLLVGLLGDNFDFSRSLLARRIGSILEKPRRTYCLDQPVPFGYVTSPVINAHGVAVGVVGYDLSPAEGGELYIRSGHPLVYQSGLFAHYLETPPSEQEAKSPQEEAWLGVFTQPLTDDHAEYWGLPKNGGVIVSTIVPGSPAEKSGFQRGDIVTEFNGIPIHAKQNQEVLDFTRVIRETGVGKDVIVKVLRAGQPLEMTTNLVLRPKSARDAVEFEDQVFGLTVREITTDVRILLNLPEDVQGVIVRRVKSGSWASIANIRPGVIIMNFGDYPVTNLEEFKQAVTKVAEQKPKEVTVFCRAGSVTLFFRMEPVWPADALK
ncbi:MAG: PDZ domain-containing protein [Candidatus Hydrogenedentes bacterium]|nr:PDZ domain-containing protein [Candidatus Hydrogenedentota bacterium]